MFSLLSGLMQWLFTKPSMRLLVLGLDNAGKTTTLEVIKSGYSQKSLPFGAITPTVGLNIARVEADGVSAFFWDLGGQVALRTLWSKYFEDCHGVLYVCDIVDVERYEESINSLLNVMQHRLFKERPIPVVVFLNKVDAIHPADRIARFRYCQRIFTDLNARISSPSLMPLDSITTRDKTTVIQNETAPGPVSLWHRGGSKDEEPNSNFVVPPDSPIHTPIRSNSEVAGTDPKIVTIVAGSALAGPRVGRLLTRLLISECKKAVADGMLRPLPRFFGVDEERDCLTPLLTTESASARGVPLLRELRSPAFGQEWVQRPHDELRTNT
eukprot:Gregarina_sp_Poly_1__463@NODE_110_length_13975_cov_113_221887_g97_i0_p4_GENE_NODE_110_length_13975_cov_113_221887_g97_i0NODE_110_length_13975_cov_113_221887_g97_i0_p4_ORF_typecomplete_len326_score43_79Arf/PF00025_21/2_3e35Gtr1_RagA/PF04670_12/1e15Galpha/PF00503_20/14Galpha/PF00503_20/1_1e09Galpha/PF00503_20/7_9e02Roc/PF08477_13/3_6e11Ras/PF00071_22/1_5e10SRPRB/PF09439_10/9_3e09GTP_EFTU/PF00009_27/4e05FeoB_N/PF02421_18/0_00021MMR_HSR1/PF01926_23/0_0021ATP_bind_1/PF03029_17/0_086AAA_22/PF13401_6/0